MPEGDEGGAPSPRPSTDSWRNFSNMTETDRSSLDRKVLADQEPNYTGTAMAPTPDHRPETEPSKAILQIIPLGEDSECMSLGLLQPCGPVTN